MNRITLAVGIVAIMIGSVGGWLASSVRAHRASLDAQSVSSVQQVDDLRKANERLGAELKSAQARIATTEADLRREHEMNARLHLLVSNGRK